MNDTQSVFFRDVFLSHASIDKDNFIKPFVEMLEEREISYWLDEAELSWGHSLLEQLSIGLSKSRFVVVFISDNFLSRNWPQIELRNALSEEISTGKLKVLPILICDVEKCFKIHPFLRDKKYINWDNNLNVMAKELEKTLGRSYEEKWSFKYPPSFRGHIWIKIMPKPENNKKLHEISIDWGRWKFEGKLDFKGDKSVILDFKKIAENKSWPVKLRISPSAFVTSGKGNPVIDINSGWKCMDRAGLSKARFNKKIQSFFPDTDETSAKLTLD